MRAGVELVGWSGVGKGMGIRGGGELGRGV